MPAKPTETDPQPVPGLAPWVWWPGLHGWPEAKRPNGTGEPVRVRARNYTQLLAAIRKTEGRRP